MGQVKLHKEAPTSESTVTSTSAQHLSNVAEGSATQVDPLLFYDVYQSLLNGLFRVDVYKPQSL